MDPHRFVGMPQRLDQSWHILVMFELAHMHVVVFHRSPRVLIRGLHDPVQRAPFEARGGVVLVTFNYRVGLEGFGYVEGMPANRGLLDQVAALEWVQHNISAFGGDPGRVTVFGQSAGGGSVAALLAMPRAVGLFRRAIAQSAPGTYLTPELAADITKACAAELGLEPAELSTVDPRLLPAAADAVLAKMGQYEGRWGRAAYARIPLAPVIDGDVLPTTPWQGLTGQVELMVGHTRHEQRLLTSLSGRLGEVTAAQATEAAAIFGPDPQRYRDAFPDPQELYDVVRSDWLFRMPSLHLAEAQLEAGGVAYLCELTWPAPGMGNGLGACHGLDVPLVFGNLAAGQPAMLIGDPTPEAAALSDQMRFACCGGFAGAATCKHRHDTLHTASFCRLRTRPRRAERG